MEISEVRVRLIPNRNSADRLRAFCSVTLDGDFVIRDLKVIDGANGIFVAMPSRKLADRCPRCHAKNHLRAKFCNECGAKLNRERVRKDAEGRPKSTPTWPPDQQPMPRADREGRQDGLRAGA